MIPFLVLAVTFGLLWSLVSPRSFFMAAFLFACVFPSEFTQTLLFTVGPMLIYPFDLVIMIMSLALLSKLLLKGFRFLIEDRIRIALLMVFLWGVFQSLRGLFSFGHSAIGQARTEYLYMIPMFYMFGFLSDAQSLAKLQRWLLFTAFAILATGIYETMMNPFTEGTRIRFLNATSTLVLSYGMVYYLERLTSHEHFAAKSRIRSVLLMVSFVLMIVIAQHRTVWVSVATMLFIGMLIYTERFRQFTLTVIITFLLTMGALVIFNLQTKGTVFLSIEESAQFLENPNADPTGQWRLLGWGQALEKALEHPILGEGFGNLFYFFDGHEWWGVAVHNGYIMRFLKQGLIGILVFAAAIWLVLRYGRRSPYYALYLIVIGHLVYNFFYGETYFLWTAVGILVLSSVPQRQGTIKSKAVVRAEGDGLETLKPAST